jgi:uncharacterized protein YkwD
MIARAGASRGSPTQKVPRTGLGATKNSQPTAGIESCRAVSRARGRSLVLWLLVLFGALSLAWQPALAGSAGTLLPDDPQLADLTVAEGTLLDLTNADRIAHWLDPLDFDADALGVARQRAETQLGLASLSHDDADGPLAFVRLLADANISYGVAGENLARGPLDPGVIQRIEQALMESPAHRKNILEPRFKHLAVGAATDSTGEITFAELYRD